ncbi:hybrid sensor histidine kinase/response regulator [Massilia scottii]|uniref:hybrid sensor histidine kinase/response regulator n=1 Tax=Massilia scottii TaxID=3057166 RepID=UPI002796DF4D|nr:ATP-binding protein [Massilia sp. CCM 9029]MDQ1833174.1 ATP-binding protein [Massilia sp. CCM 9029]
MRHQRLLRQLRRTLGVSSERALQERLGGLRALGDPALAEGLAALLDAVSRSYEESDRDLQVRTRMLEISSDELTGANDQLRAEAARQGEVLRSLQASLGRLATPADPQAGGDDLLGLTRALEQLLQQRESARELTEQILDQLPIPVFLKDRQGCFVRFNRQFQEFTRRSRAEIEGRTIDEVGPRRWAGQTREEDEQAWRSGRMVTSERRLANLDPPVDVVVSRIVIHSGGESYLLGFSIDVSEQRAARDAMQRAVESAQAASRAKSDFLANMSHEIRTPMNGILGMTELVLESALAPQQREDIELVKGSADALLTIIDDILDFSKIEAGKLDIDDVPFDLGKLVRETLRSLALPARQKGLVLACELPPHLPPALKGDPGRLRQVLINLLGNAIKFTSEGGVTLSVTLRRVSEQRCDVEFAVRDTGIGIAPDQQTLIFDAFSQVDGSPTRQYGGTGLGLTICRRLVMLMHGDISVSSEPGRGSVFRFTVPLGQTAAAPAAAPAHGRASVAPAPGSATLAREQAGRLHIVLAEDNPVNQRLALRLLEKMGHRVTVADNGLDALEHALHGGADLVLMDVQMPGLDGMAATRAIRRWEAAHGGHVPVVAMTARAMQGDRERCLEAGMDDYLSKPVDSARLREVLARFHGGRPGAVLDWHGALLRLDGDRELLHELAALFISDGPQLFDALDKALAAGDTSAAQRAAHSLRGVLVNFGAGRAIACSERITATLRDAVQAPPARALAHDLAAALDDVYAALGSHLAI